MREQVHRQAAATGAAGAANAVRVRVGVGRQFVADHGRKVGNVQAARGDVGGDQHAQLPL